MKQAELDDVLIPLVYGDPVTLADGLARMAQSSEAEQIRRRMERRTEEQMARARAKLHEKLERLRRKRERKRPPDGAPF